MDETVDKTLKESKEKSIAMISEILSAYKTEDSVHVLKMCIIEQAEKLDNQIKVRKEELEYATTNKRIFEEHIGGILKVGNIS